MTVKLSPVRWGRVPALGSLTYSIIQKRGEVFIVPATEQRLIDEVFKKVALANPKAAFTLISDKRELHVEAAQAYEDQQRLQNIMGEGFAKHALWVTAQGEGIAVEGYITDPQFQRAKGDMQYLFLNGRPIKEQALSMSVKQAYHDVMYQRNQPGFCALDNGRPSKYRCKCTLQKSRWHRFNIKPITSLLFHMVKERLAVIRPQHHFEAYHRPAAATFVTKPVAPILPPQSEIKIEQPTVPMQHISSHQSTENEREKQLDAPKEILGKAIAQLLGVYILSQSEEGLIIVDMHAAHERILYEGFKAQYAKDGIVSQTLLVAIECQLSPVQSEIVDKAAANSAARV